MRSGIRRLVAEIRLRVRILRYPGTRNTGWAVSSIPVVVFNLSHKRFVLHELLPSCLRLRFEG